MNTKWFRIKLPKNKSSGGDTTTIFILLLGFVEFAIASIFILMIDPDPKNAVLFGFSFQRIVLFLLTLTSGIVLLFLALQIYRGKFGSRLEIQFQRHYNFWIYLSFVLALGGLIVLISPVSLLGIYGNYFGRIRPLLVVACLFPIQFCLKWLFKEKHLIDKHLLRDILVSLIILFLIFCFIVITRLGITPETFTWNVAGIPMSGIQFISILLITTLIQGIIIKVQNSFPNQSNFKIDLIICIGLFLFAVFIWGNTPMTKHYFSIQPQIPFNQPFPSSDARVHDLGALSIIKGWGINFGGYTDKPLYMVFLAVLHWFAGYDYNLITQLQIFVLALIGPILYLFGKSFHSRFLGLLISLFILIRQRNAIVLSLTIASVNPRLLTTEVPTLLCLIVLNWLVFLWLKKHEEKSLIPFAIGGILGIASLIRMNPLMLLPTILLYSLFVMWKRKTKWLKHAMAIIAGCGLLIIPWLVTGTNANGQPYLLLKILDVINFRYTPQGMELRTTPKLALVEPFRNKNNFRGIQIHSDGVEPPIDIHSFPGFVINHFFYNFVGGFLALPDSFILQDQTLNTLAERPYWEEANKSNWAGEIDTHQIPFVIINLCLIGMGIGWSWKYWKWAGIFPIYFFGVYSLSLGLARSSGSRYLVPIDWVIFFYFAIGITLLLNFLPKSLRPQLEAEHEKTINLSSEKYRSSKKQYAWMIAIFFFITALIPIADNLVPEQSILCDNNSLTNIETSLISKDSIRDMSFMKGEFLYPIILGENLEFELLTCRKTQRIEIQRTYLDNFNANRAIGKMVIIGWPAVSDNPSGVNLVLQLKNQIP